ncbi:CDP-alcohol phosphatidyltransferase family protein [Williamsia sterculiae]|uniref:CDP-diacylglycerol---serine O-phosphatidyltransferase n=1 Tax=Williamsia sterculiae TaxID=1344003 RepID=A0A1N7F046_9NOCA|nr:phosphatidylcholine/phosphatidylserine synthase [Williamsia sterculiae]SIR93644.1 CDP-diacylglycerol---serine O-phosphatidyltransferase [Williamsia sterculiae]
MSVRAPKPDRPPGSHPRRRPTRRQSSFPPSGRMSVPSALSGGGRLLVPSALTVLAICAGLSSVKFALDNRVDLSIAMIAAAALLDGLDGRVARLLGATTKIGAELDSLADAINFGVAPALTIYLVLMRDNNVGWVLALVYCCAIVLRLARFNILADDEDQPEWSKGFFVGVPAPATAIIALAPVAGRQQWGDGWWESTTAVAVWTVLSALLAVSRIPTASLKSWAVPQRALAAILFVVAVAAALLVTYPYLLMLLAIAAYLLHIPFAWRTQSWVRARPDTWDYAPSERRAERKAMRRARRPRPRVSEARLGLRRPR